MENYSTMTLDQLMERQKMIYKKYSTAVAANVSPALLNQMILHMEQIKQAIWEITYKQNFDLKNKNATDSFKDSII